MQTKSKRNATAEFAAHVAEIDRLIKELQETVDNHFGVSPDDVHLGHVDSAEYFSEKLRAVVDGCKSTFGDE